MERIDAHHHFWAPEHGDYGWLPPDDPVLSRPYGPAELAPALAAAGVSRTVLVQAAPTVAETERLLSLADETPHVAAVVGWIDFERRESRRILARLALCRKFAGVRPMIQDIPDDDWMLGAQVDWAFRALVDFDLAFDALALPRHIDRLLTLLARHPRLRVVLDHCLKPPIRDGAAPPDWAAGMTRLARETGAFVKLSGLVTEADPDWTAATLKPVVDHVLDAFGPARVMWGSDWPVCRLRCEYGRWRDAALELTAGLDAAERDMVFGGTARAFYRLPAPGGD